MASKKLKSLKAQSKTLDAAKDMAKAQEKEIALEKKDASVFTSEGRKKRKELKAESKRLDEQIDNIEDAKRLSKSAQSSIKSDVGTISFGNSDKKLSKATSKKVQKAQEAYAEALDTPAGASDKTKELSGDSAKVASGGILSKLKNKLKDKKMSHDDKVDAAENLMETGASEAENEIEAEV